MSLQIYHVPGTRSVRPVWLCFELQLEVDIQIVDWSPAYRASPAWRKISPAGKVPVLIDEGFKLFESGAMVEYLLDKHDDGSLRPPANKQQRALYNQWCWFAEATLIRPLGLHRMLKARTESVDSLVDEAERKFRDALDVVENALVDSDYILGERFTAADIMMGYSVFLVERFLSDQPYLQRYADRLRQRAAFQQVTKVTRE